MLRTRTATVVAASALAAGVATGAVGYAAVSGNGLGSSASPAASTAAGTPTASSTSSSNVGAIYERANDSVVEITVTSQSSSGPSDSPFPFGDGQQQQTQQAQGSGFVYDTDGHVVTNEHVVEGATSVKITFSDGSTYDATVVGSDPSTDLAVLKVDAPASELHPLALADSDNVAVGDGVVAIGSPYGLEGTVTTGIVSALDRTIQSTNGYSIPGAIQTDAAINHGNSGGVLLNMQGKVIGVTSQIESESGGNVGIGFAIPSNTVRSVVDQLVSGKEVEHAYLGVSLQTAESGGAQVATVTSGSPAAEAGLKAGDVVTQVDGETVTSADDLTAAVLARQPGDTVSITVERDGSTKTLKVTLGTRPSS
jgi:putative serine protease PepD